MEPINNQVAEFLQKQELVTLGFSTGKDSVCCATVLKNLGVKFIPFFFYHIPELDFIERNIKMYEDIFEVDVIRMPHPMLYDYLRHQDFQPPEMIEYLAKYDFAKLTFEDLIGAHLESIGIAFDCYDVVGQRAAESFNRRKLFEKQGFFNHKRKKVFPICDWNKQDVLDYLKANNIPLTDDYKIWNRSFDGLKYQFLFGVREKYPSDFEKIKELFPLIELELKRYEFNQQYY